jgi:diguanylate cyclase (GGDEF)-like protein
MDVTEAHELSNQLSYQATYDDLTGLVNRREFEDRLQEVIELAQERRSENVLCYLDLDQFKVINDTCGHMAGDELLRQLAQELYRCVRRDDTLARLGGDEFAILLENCSIENAERAANNVRHAVQNFRFMWNENMFTIGVSIGLTLISQDGESISEVLRRADAACYAAKEAGRNRLHVFRMDDKELALRHQEMSWVSRVNAALEEDRLELWHQEIAEISRDELPQGNTAEDHFEILLRMRDTDGSLIMPGTFLPAVERYTLAAKIDRWVLKALFRWLAENPLTSDRIGICAVNLSGQTLGDLSFHNEVIALLENSNVRADRICFEITETSAIANLSNATLFMQRLKQHGCTFALDDFGSGLSSFAYLKSLPVDFVKIDGLFVKDILSDPVDRAMVKAIIEMAHAMGKLAIAEFVENDAILQELIDLGVDYVQGYGIGRPAPLR